MVSAVLTASGKSLRFGRDKLFAKIDGIPVIGRTAMQFDKAGGVDEIVVVVRKSSLEKFRSLFGKLRIKVRLVEGGKERVHSVRNGVREALGNFVVTHDGSRPLVPVSLIERLIIQAKKHKCVMTAQAATATVKYVKDSIIKRSFKREETWIAQTPQAFEKRIALEAFEKAIASGFLVSTDDSELVERIGEQIRVIPGDDRNIKVTTPTDLLIARQIWRQYEGKL